MCKMVSTISLIVLFCCLIIKLGNSLECKNQNNNEICDEDSVPVTIDKIKMRLKESGIFDWDDPSLTNAEKQELALLQDTLFIITSRNRQPSNVQNYHVSLILVKDVVNEQVKSGRISKSLAKKFHWKKIAESKAA